MYGIDLLHFIRYFFPCSSRKEKENFCDADSVQAAEICWIDVLGLAENLAAFTVFTEDDKSAVLAYLFCVSCT